MAKPATIVTKDAPLTFGVSGMPTFSIAEILSAATAEMTAQGVAVWNGSITVRVVDVPDVNGNPTEIKLTLRAVRSPRDVGEFDACQKLATEANYKKLTRKAEDQEAREREIKRAGEHIIAGMAAQADMAARVDTASKVKEALTIAEVLGSLVQKRIA